MIETSTVIEAPIAVVWRVFSDVTAWPMWTSTVRSIEILDDARSLQPGTRVRVAQPRLPTMVWTVSDLDDGASWTWKTRRLGSRTIAGHRLVPVTASRTLVTQSIEHRGPLGVMAGRMYARQTRRHLDVEGRGLKRAAESEADARGDASSQGVD